MRWSATVPFLAAFAALATPTNPVGAQQVVPAPESVFGFAVGADS